eukprot:5301182-Amphidinium_carterae.1
MMLEASRLAGRANFAGICTFGQVVPILWLALQRAAGQQGRTSMYKEEVMALKCIDECFERLGLGP